MRSCDRYIFLYIPLAGHGICGNDVTTVLPEPFTKHPHVTVLSLGCFSHFLRSCGLHLSLPRFFVVSIFGYIFLNIYLPAHIQYILAWGCNQGGLPGGSLVPWYVYRTLWRTALLIRWFFRQYCNGVAKPSSILCLVSP